jgi:type III secretory pathway lipoprotein EscJ
MWGSDNLPKIHLPKIALLFIYSILLLCLTGCSEEQILGEIDQLQANQIVAVLSQHGIVSHARKGGMGGSKYAVYVSDSDYSLAVSLLQAHQLPREKQASFSELTTAKGFMPVSSEIEALRLDHALGLEIEEKLRALARVADVKVAVRLHSVSSPEQVGATVIVIPEKDYNPELEQFSRALELLVPGISPARIQVIVGELESKQIVVSKQGVTAKGVSAGANNAQMIYRPLVPFLYLFEVPVGEHRALALLLLVCIVVTALSCCILGFVSGRRYDALKRMRAGLPESKNRVRDGRVGLLRARTQSGMDKSAELIPSQRFIGGTGNGPGNGGQS